METFKLQKLIADSGFCSRRQAETLIKQKRVEINNKIAKIGDRASCACQIKIDGQLLENKPPKKIYLILNKPVGFVSTMHDEKGRKTAADLIKQHANSRVFIVGRLDLNSQGLMLFTNDGELMQKITHPKNHIKKIYEVKISKRLSMEEIKQLEQGIVLDGKKTAPAKIKPVEEKAAELKTNQPTSSSIVVELHEGKKRQIRRMMETLNAKVLKLKRVQIGPVKLGALRLGHCRKLTSTEIKALKKATHSAQKLELN